MYYPNSYFINILFWIVGILITFAVVVSFVLISSHKEIKRLLKESELKSIERHELHEEWLFKSLYSINKEVLLPEDKEKPIISKKAIVFSPTEDGMSEFNGLKTDFLEE